MYIFFVKILGRAGALGYLAHSLIDYVSVMDLILAVVQLLGKDISGLVVKAWDTLELVKLWDKR